MQQIIVSIAINVKPQFFNKSGRLKNPVNKLIIIGMINNPKYHFSNIFLIKLSFRNIMPNFLVPADVGDFRSRVFSAERNCRKKNANSTKSPHER